MEVLVAWLIGIAIFIYVFVFLMESAARLAGEMFDFFEHLPIYISIPLALIAGGLIIYFILIRFQWFHNLMDGNFNKAEYVICPYCDKSVLFQYDWECDHCHNTQGVGRALNKPCVHCKRKLKSFYCDNCEKEILL